MENGRSDRKRKSYQISQCRRYPLGLMSCLATVEGGERGLEKPRAAKQLHPGSSALGFEKAPRSLEPVPSVRGSVQYRSSKSTVEEGKKTGIPQGQGGNCCRQE